MAEEVKQETPVAVATGAEMPAVAVAAKKKRKGKKSIFNGVVYI
jgi:hypothetical protein